MSRRRIVDRDGCAEGACRHDGSAWREICGKHAREDGDFSARVAAEHIAENLSTDFTEEYFRKAGLDLLA